MMSEMGIIVFLINIALECFVDKRILFSSTEVNSFGFILWNSEQK